jgi:hypothetical protein
VGGRGGVVVMVAFTLRERRKNLNSNVGLHVGEVK